MPERENNPFEDFGDRKKMSQRAREFLAAMADPFRASSAKESTRRDRQLTAADLAVASNEYRNAIREFNALTGETDENTFNTVANDYQAKRARYIEIYRALNPNAVRPEDIPHPDQGL